MCIDLHIHSYYSDGALSPERILNRALRVDFKVIAIVDHNNIEGTKKILEIKDKKGVKVIPGVEIYTRYKNQHLHLLGYNFDLRNKDFLQRLENLQKEHLENIRRCIKNLQKIGFEIEFEELIQTFSKYISLGHIIHLLEKKLKNLKKLKINPKTQKADFFDTVSRYFIKGKKAYLREVNLPIEEGINLIKKAKGISVLAHPGQQLSWKKDWVIRKLKDLGLQGVEVFSPCHNWHQIEHNQNLVLELELLMTAGSDFHCDIDFTKKEFIRNQWDYFKPPYSIYEKLEPYFDKSLKKENY